MCEGTHVILFYICFALNTSEGNLVPRTLFFASPIAHGGEKTLGMRLREPWDFLSKNMESWYILRPILGFLRNSIWQLW